MQRKLFVNQISRGTNIQYLARYTTSHNISNSICGVHSIVFSSNLWYLINKVCDWLARITVPLVPPGQMCLCLPITPVHILGLPVPANERVVAVSLQNILTSSISRYVLLFSFSKKNFLANFQRFHTNVHNCINIVFSLTYLYSSIH